MLLSFWLQTRGNLAPATPFGGPFPLLPFLGGIEVGVWREKAPFFVGGEKSVHGFFVGFVDAFEVEDLAGVWRGLGG